MSILDLLRSAADTVQAAIRPEEPWDPTPAEIQDAFVGLVAHHCEHLGIPVRREGRVLSFGEEQMAVELRLTDCPPGGLTFEYSIGLPELGARRIVQPVTFPHTDRTEALMNCHQLVADGVLAPILASLGYRWPEIDVRRTTAQLADASGTGVAWEIFSGPTLVYADSHQNVQAASVRLDHGRAVFDVVRRHMEAITAQPGLHWWKAMYARFPDGETMGDVWYDDDVSAEAYEDIRRIEMPGSGFLMYRQFGVLRPARGESQA
jgi:hypothetical protein